MKWPLHITLTEPNRPELDVDALRALSAALRRLRQRKAWKLTVRGGFCSTEITNRGNGWHIHAHIIADCDWYGLQTAPPPSHWGRERKHAVYVAASAELAEDWGASLRPKHSAPSVRIRRKYGGATGAKSLAAEAMKYSIKPADLLAPKIRASTAIDAMTRVRMFRGFGSCYKLTVPDEEEKLPCACPGCGIAGTMMPESVIEEMLLRQREKKRGR
jgi:diadenosine tetraphosphate (Ap4A) HIT family hydrolase